MGPFYRIKYKEHLKAEILKVYNVTKQIYSDKPVKEYDPKDFNYIDAKLKK